MDDLPDAATFAQQSATRGALARQLADIERRQQAAEDDAYDDEPTPERRQP